MDLYGWYSGLLTIVIGTSLALAIGFSLAWIAIGAFRLLHRRSPVD